MLKQFLMASTLAGMSLSAAAQTAEQPQLDTRSMEDARTTQQVNQALEQAGYSYRLAIPHVKNRATDNASSFLAVRESDGTGVFFSMERASNGRLNVEVIEQLTNITYVADQPAHLAYSQELALEGEATCGDNPNCVSVGTLSSMISNNAFELAFSGTKANGEIMVGLVDPMPKANLRNRCEFMLQTGILETEGGALSGTVDVPPHCGPQIFRR